MYGFDRRSKYETVSAPLVSLLNQSGFKVCIFAKGVTFHFIWTRAITVY